MPKVIDIPAPLRALVCHGAELRPVHASGDEYVGDCPLGCGKSKFYCKGSGLWSCKVGCGEGNTYDFLRLVHDISMRGMRDYSWLSTHRNVPADVLRAWGVCKSYTTGEWIVPGYGAGGGIVNLYRYVLSGGKYRLYSTPGISSEQGEDAGHGFFRPTAETFPDGKLDLDVCEGPWDGMALWYANATCGQPERASRIVIAVPGCGVWKASWNRLGANRTVTFFYDNDHPRPNEKTGTITQAAHTGLRRAVGMIASVAKEDAPKEIRYLCWSGNNTQADPGFNGDLADGFDVRDLVGAGSTVEQITSMVRPVPNEWVAGKSVTRGANKGEQVRPVPCTSWKKLRGACVKAAQWTPELNGALAIMVASVVSVREQGEQLWVRVISPPSTGKSMVAGMVACAGKRYVIEDDGMNGFFSGYKDAAKGEEQEDYSLASRLYDKTLLTKEGATLMKSHARESIIADARALYDGSATRAYKNGLNWAHYGLRCTWILCGVPSMRGEDLVELGPRFIDYTIMDSVDEVTETSIVERAIAKQYEAQISNCKADTTLDPRYREACQLCGGYIDYLRKNVEQLAAAVEIDAGTLKRVGKLAVFIEFMRARPSLKNEEGSDRAMAARIAGQLVKWVRYLCVVFQVRTVTKDVKWLVEKMARDTSYGRTLEIVRVLDSCGNVGLDLSGVTRRTRQDGTQLSREKEGTYLEFLTRIGALEQFDPEDEVASIARRARWRLSDKFRKLYHEVVSKSPEWKKVTA